VGREAVPPGGEGGAEVQAEPDAAGLGDCCVAKLLTPMLSAASMETSKGPSLTKLAAAVL